MSFNGWEEVKLKDLISSVSETYKQKSEKVVLINTSDVLEGTVLNHSYVDNKNLKGQFKKTFQRDDILYSEIRPKNKRFAYVDFDPNDYIASTKLMVLRRKTDRIDSKYLFQLMKNDSFINTLQSLAETRSGTFPQITFTELGMQSIMLPSLKEQESIAYILSTLDDKIEVNNRINETLENMAQEIFKRWFVDFEFPNEDGEPYKSCGGEMVESELGLIPRGWEIVSLDYLTSRFTTGLNPRKNFVLGHGDNYYVTIKNMTEQDVILDDRCDKIDDQALYIINKRSDLKRRDILFSGIGTIGRVYFIDEEPRNWNISESIFTLRAKNDRVSEYLYFLLLSSNFQMYAKHLASGSVQKGIRMADLKKYKLAFSLDLAANKFYKVANLILKTYKNNKKENRKLVKMRDALLSKLMSGEVRVPIEES